MLKIRSSEQLTRSMELAKETHTEESLIKWLLYLHNWADLDKVEVRLHSDIPSSPGSIMWYAHHIKNGQVEDDCFYNGGLIFNRDANEWMIYS